MTVHRPHNQDMETTEYQFVEGMIEAIQDGVQQYAKEGWRLVALTPVRLGPGGIYEYCAAMERPTNPCTHAYNAAPSSTMNPAGANHSVGRGTKGHRKEQEEP